MKVPQLLPRKGGKLWRFKQRWIKGIRVYKGIDSSIWQPYMDSFKFLGFTKGDIVRLVNLFLRIDKDRSGSIDMFELLLAEFVLLHRCQSRANKSE